VASQRTPNPANMPILVPIAYGSDTSRQGES
jgi:hypothetical protein